MLKQAYPVAQNPLILRFHRLMDAFAKSDDERDFYLDRVEGFIFFVDLDKGADELAALEKEIEEHGNRYCLLPKMTFYESKKFMEAFINEKVYDIDTKERLLDIIQSKEARENFLEFIYDQLTELEKWQQFYVERSRIRIIEWLRSQEILFVFEEDLDMTKNLIEKLKKHLFDAKVPREVAVAREALSAKAKTYYSSEALNPRPKRGRPPKQAAKVELEPQMTVDIYTTVPPTVRHFLFIPDISSASAVTFSTRYESEAQLLANLRGSSRVKVDEKLQALSEKLESLRHLSHRLTDLHEMGAFEAEEKLMKAMRKEVPIVPIEEVEIPKKKGIMDVIKGFLPKREAAPAKPKEGEAAEEYEQKKRRMKMVTPIQQRKKNKKKP
ncbi:MAG TPA: UPF0158 family protein [Rhabdochlamydiaceae bacterium]|nr:UPF0158 family protein [Rhabdochlamydiaceae bacterium]